MEFHHLGLQPEYKSDLQFQVHHLELNLLLLRWLLWIQWTYQGGKEWENLHMWGGDRPEK